MFKKKKITKKVPEKAKPKTSIKKAPKVDLASVDAVIKNIDNAIEKADEVAETDDIDVLVKKFLESNAGRCGCL